MTQEKFAEKLGTIRETVAKWEAGTSEPSWAYIEKIVERFPYASLVDGAPKQFADRDLQRAATRAYSQDFLDDKSSYGAQMLPLLAEVSADGLDLRTGLPQGLDHFLKHHGASITRREKLFLARARFRFDGTLWMDDTEWWFFLKLVGRGYYMGQAKDAPPEVLEEKMRQAASRLEQRQQDLPAELVVDRLNRIKGERFSKEDFNLQIDLLIREVMRLEQVSKSRTLSSFEADVMARAAVVLKEYGQGTHSKK